MSELWHTLLQQIDHSESTQFIAKVFGGWIYSVVGLSTPSNAPESTIVTLFTGQLSTFVWIIFITLFIYLAVSSVLNSARKGSWVKQEWSGMWGVIRLTMGAAAVAPVSKTGIIGACWVVMWLALVSSGSADLLWGKVLKVLGDSSLDAQYTRLSQVLDEKATHQLMDGAFSYVSCCVNKIDAADDKDVTLSSFNPINPGTNPLAQKIAKGCSNPSYQDYLSLTHNDAAPRAPSGNQLDGGTLAAYEKAQIDYLIRDTVFDYTHSQIWQFYTDNFSSFKNHDIPSSLTSSWQHINDNFYNDISNKLKSAIEDDKNLETEYAKNVSKYGWVSAGNYYLQLAGEEAAISFALNSALQNTPNYVDPSKEKAFTDADAIADVNTLTALSWLQNTAGSQNSSDTTDPFKIYLLKPSATQDPILAMSRFGHSLEDIAVGAFVGREVVSIFSWIPGISDVDKLVNNGAMETANIMMAGIGTVLGTVLPVMPTIFFAFCVISWFIYLLQMFIISPFWLVANASPEGEGMSSTHAKKGFNNALFVACFPIFAIGGLTAAILVSRLGMWIINAIFYQQLSAMTGTMSIPLAFIGLTLLYAITAWSVITNSMALVQTVPRTLLDWLSLSEPGMHPFNHAGETIQSGSMEKVGQMAAGTVQTASKGLVKAGGFSHNMRSALSRFETRTRQRQTTSDAQNNGEKPN